MKRRQQFSSPEREVQPKKASDVDRNKCFIFQDDSTENLCCPLNSKSCKVQQSYTSLAQRIPKYKCFKELAAQMNLESLKDGAELRQLLLQHGAKHHKKCYEVFSIVQVEHMEKSKIKNEIRENRIDGLATKS